jgi:hypothetical protein
MSLVLFAASLGEAQDVPEEPPPAVEEARTPTQENPMEVAREHMERGQALHQAGRFIESAEEFLRAYEAQPFAAFLFNAGVAYEKVGDPGRAADYFQRYLTADSQADDAPATEKRIERLRGLARAQAEQAAAQTAAAQAQSAESSAQGQAAIEEAKRAALAAEAELAAARKRLSDLEEQLAQVKGAESFKSLLSVQTKPQDATIILKDASGKVLGKGTGSPFAQTLDEGRYIVQVDHPKYKSISTPLTVAPGKVYVIITEMSQGQFLGFLRVVTNVPGAKVFMDKKEEGAVGKTPYQNAVSTGKHHIWVEKPGYEPIEQDIEVGVGDTDEVKFELTRVDYGKIRVLSNRADAQVFIDGKAVGQVPVEHEVKGGQHRVRVTAPDMKVWTENVSVENGQVTPVRVRLRPAVSHAGAWATASVSAALLGAGITTSVMGHKLEDDLKKDRDAGLLTNDDSRVTKGKILYITADVSYLLAAGLAGLATYYFLRDPLPDSEGRVLKPRDWTFAPILTPERAGVTALSRF